MRCKKSVLIAVALFVICSAYVSGQSDGEGIKKIDLSADSELRDILKISKQDPPKTFSVITSEAFGFYAAGFEADLSGEYRRAAVCFGKALVIAPHSASIAAAFGKALVQLGLRDEAFLYLKRSVNFGLDDADIYVELAGIYNARGEPLAARDTLEQYLARFVDRKIGAKEERFESIVRVLGSFYQARDKLSDAIRVYEILRKVSPTNFHAHIQLGKIYDKRRNYTAAARIYEGLSRISPSRREVQLVLINAYHNASEYRNAYRALKSYLRSRPEEKDMLYLMGKVCIKLGRNKEAIGYYQILYNNNPNLVSVLGRIVLLMAKTGEDKKVIEIVRDSIKNKKENYSMYRGLEIVAAKMEADTASKLYTEIIGLYPKHIYPYLTAARFEKSQGNDNYALSILDKAINRGVNPHQAHINKALMLVSDKRAMEATKELRAAVSLKPDDYETHILLSQLLYELGHPKSAETELVKILSVRPKSATANYLMARILVDRGRFEPALVSAEMAVAVDSPRVEHLNLLGWVLFKTGNTKGALKILLQVSKSAPSALNWEWIGDVYKEMGQAKESRMAYREALKLAPESKIIKSKLRH